jgi:hypothetical protein
MRPDPHNRHSQPAPNRVIYLGDVRRKRALRHRAPDRQYLAALVLVALVAWAIWLTVLATVPPARLLTYVAFLGPLWVAIASTGALAAYGIDWRRGLLRQLSVSLRRGVFAATLVVLNLALRAAHHWSLIVVGASLVAAALLEIALSQRGR